MRLFVKTGTKCIDERRYILNVILAEFLRFDLEVIEEERSSTLLILDGHCTLEVDDHFFSLASEHWLKAESLPSLPLRKMEGGVISDEMPVIYGRSKNENWVERKGNHIWLGLDVFGSAFYMLSRYEEAVFLDRDEHGRFASKDSLAHKMGFLRRPLIDEYVVLLWNLLSSLMPSLKKPEPTFCTLVSHDVDNPTRFLPSRPVSMLKGAAGAIIHRRKPREAVRTLRAWIYSLLGNPTKDPYCTFSWIMQESEKRGLTSAFYFIPRKTHQSFDQGYDIGASYMEYVFKEISARGHEIGLHPGYETFNRPERIIEGVKMLQGALNKLGIDQEVCGGRQHYLRWDVSITPRAWDDAGMEYDSSLSYADQVGFRCGVCREYIMYDLKERRQLSLRQRPLVFMECSLIDARYMNLGTGEEALQVALELKQACKKVAGDFTVLWHNQRLVSEEEKNLYLAILDG